MSNRLPNVSVALAAYDPEAKRVNRIDRIAEGWRVHYVGLFGKERTFNYVV